MNGNSRKYAGESGCLIVVQPCCNPKELSRRLDDLEAAADRLHFQVIDYLMAGKMLPEMLYYWMTHECIGAILARSEKALGNTEEARKKFIDSAAEFGAVVLLWETGFAHAGFAYAGNGGAI